MATDGDHGDDDVGDHGNDSLRLLSKSNVLEFNGLTQSDSEPLRDKSQL